MRSDRSAPGLSPGMVGADLAERLDDTNRLLQALVEQGREREAEAERISANLASVIKEQKPGEVTEEEVRRAAKARLRKGGKIV